MDLFGSGRPKRGVAPESRKLFRGWKGRAIPISKILPASLIINPTSKDPVFVFIEGGGAFSI